MALAASVIWEVNKDASGANANNGGGFDPVSGTPGTDYSQGAGLATIAYTDLVIGGTTTQLTSAGRPFVSADVGNILNVTSGTGFTTGRYQVMSVAGSTATMDRSVGTGGSTGGNGVLGGSVTWIGAVSGATVSGNYVYVKKATTAYVHTSSMTTVADWCHIIGYDSTRTYENTGTAPTIEAGANTITLIVPQGSSHVRNLTLDGKNGTYTSVYGVKGTSAAWVYGLLDRCLIKNCTLNAVSMGTNPWKIRNCHFKDNTFTVIAVSSYSIIEQCVFEGNTASLLASSQVKFYRNLCINNTGASNDAISTTLCEIDRCTFYGQGRDAIRGSQTQVTNNIFVNCGGYANNNTTAGDTKKVICRNNAYYNNTSGNTVNITNDVGAISLSGDPFTNAGSGDFSLDNTAGQGAACRAVASQLCELYSTTTGYADIGAVQHQDAGGSSSILVQRGMSGGLT